MKKTVKKTAMRPGANGGLLRTGNPGCKGGTGRPRNEWRDYWMAAVNKNEVLRAAAAILSDENHPQYKNVLAWAAEQAYGKNPEVVSHTHRILVVSDVAELESA